MAEFKMQLFNGGQIEKLFFHIWLSGTQKQIFAHVCIIGSVIEGG